jgi:hypothetical protein
MAHRIHISDPAWQTTFPHLVAPLHNEWLAGFLLRCDEVNLWQSGTTVMHLLREVSKERIISLDLLDLIVPSSSFPIQSLAQLLAVQTSTVVATTYLAELSRLYDIQEPHPTQLTSSFSFRLCPVCVAEERLLSRTLTLPHLSACPQHHVTLMERCQCGMPLRPFQRRRSPFTCSACGLDWAKLSSVEADPRRVKQDSLYLAFYEFFLTSGTPKILASALRLIYDSVVEKGAIRTSLHDENTRYPHRGRSYQQTTSLGHLVRSLIELHLCPRDILIYAGSLPWRSVKWLTFQCPVESCPYTNMMQQCARLLSETGNGSPEME